MKKSDDGINPSELSDNSFNLDDEFHVDFGEDFDSIMDDAMKEENENAFLAENSDDGDLEEFNLEEDDWEEEDNGDVFSDEEYEYVDGKRPTKFDKGLNIVLSVGGSIIGILTVVLVVIIWNGLHGDEVKVTKGTSQKEESTDQTGSTEKEIITMFEEPDATTDTEISTFYVQQMSEEEEYSRWEATQTENTDSGETTPEETTTEKDTTEEDTTEEDTTEEDTTEEDTTEELTTPEPTTPEPTTPEPTTPEPTTPEPTTPEPATEEPTTPEPATPEPPAETSADAVQ